MTPRTMVLTPVLLALVAGLVWKRSSAGDSDTEGRHAVTSTAAAAPATPSPEIPKSGHTAWRIRPSSAATAAAELPLQVSVDAAEAIAEQITLRQFADGRGLALSDEQWTAAAALVAHYQAVRQAYEASIAEVRVLPDGQFELAIPAYAEVGDVLRAKLQLGLEQALGIETADRFTAGLGSALEGYFAGFGVGTQTLRFAAQSDLPGDYLIVRRATYWNSLSDRDQLTTRLESHWPDSTPSARGRWSPFFERLAAHSSAQRG